MESKSSVDDPFSHLDPRNVPLQFHAQQTHVTTNPTNPTNPTNLSNPTTTNAVDGPNFTNSVNETLGFRANSRRFHGSHRHFGRNSRDESHANPVPFVNPAAHHSAMTPISATPTLSPMSNTIGLTNPTDLSVSNSGNSGTNMNASMLESGITPMQTVTVVRTSVNGEDVMREWRDVHRVWSTAAKENRLKRELEEKHERQLQQEQERHLAQQNANASRTPLTRLGGSPIGPFTSNSSSIDIGEPPMLFNPSSMSMLFNLLMGGSGSSNSIGGFDPFPNIFHTSTRPGPSGRSNQILMMSQTSSSSSSPWSNQQARMVFNDRRLDAAAAHRTQSQSQSQSQSNPFASGAASNRWGELLRAAAAAQRNNTAMPVPVPRANPPWAQPLNESAFQSTLQRSLYDIQPRAPNLRNGGNTLIDLATPPPVSETENCTICLDNDRNQLWSLLPCCKNALHKSCAQRWLQNDIRCPICRTPVP